MDTPRVRIDHEDAERANPAVAAVRRRAFVRSHLEGLVRMAMVVGRGAHVPEAGRLGAREGRSGIHIALFTGLMVESSFTSGRRRRDLLIRPEVLAKLMMPMVGLDLGLTRP